MKKRILALILGVSMMAALVGCGSESASDMVTIEQYKGLEVAAVTPAEVTDEEVESSIAYTLQAAVAMYAEEHGIKDRAAAEGDTVLIDYEGKLDGVAFTGGTASNQTATLGSGGYIPGFEEGIVGHMPGETFDIDVTFPEDYGNEELNGQAVVFTIKLHAIAATELTDGIATALVGADTTVEEYKQIVKEDLEASNAETAVEDYEDNVYRAFIENCTMEEYPEEELENWMTIIEDSYAMYASYYGMETDDYLQAYYGVTIEDLAKEQVRFNYAVQVVAEQEDLVLSLEEYDTAVEEQATQYGYETAEEFESAYEEYYGEGYLKNYLLQEKVMDWLVENSKTME